jgi:hypothetical protein
VFANFYEKIKTVSGMYWLSPASSLVGVTMLEIKVANRTWKRSFIVE